MKLQAVISICRFFFFLVTARHGFFSDSFIHTVLKISFFMIVFYNLVITFIRNMSHCFPHFLQTPGLYSPPASGYPEEQGRLSSLSVYTAPHQSLDCVFCQLYSGIARKAFQRSLTFKNVTQPVFLHPFSFPPVRSAFALSFLILPGYSCLDLADLPISTCLHYFLYFFNLVILPLSSHLQYHCPKPPVVNVKQSKKNENKQNIVAELSVCR